MIVTTGNEVSGFSITDYLGIVRGVAIRGFHLFVRSEEALAKLCEIERGKAHRRMVAEAAAIGADAIIGVRYDSTPYSRFKAEIFAYGTAVKLVRS